jgi:hypothetical protein
MRYWLSLGLVLGSLSLAWAQQAPPASADQQVRQLQYELNLCDMESRSSRRTLAQELRQAVERAERAEQALASAPKPAGPAKAEAPAEGK